MFIYKKRLFSALAILLLTALISAMLTLAGCAAKTPEPISETRLLLDTVCTVTIYGQADHALLTEALDLCAQYEALFSRTIEGSDIWRINHAQGAPVEVDPQTAELIRAGLEYGDLSGGLFDISIGRVSSLWDFGGNPAVPATADLAAAQDTVDYKQVEVSGNTVHLPNAGAWLDLGGIAKGYIADQLAAFLQKRGVTGAIIDLGGDIVAIGAKPDGSPWHIGVNQPFSSHSELLGTLSITEASVVTSGIYERQFEETGVFYHHILNPASGMPAQSDVVSATVVAKSGAIGEGLSTTIILLGSEKAAALLEQAPGLIGAILMLDTGELLQYGDIDFVASR